MTRSLKLSAVVLMFFCAFAASAATITSVTPNHGPAAGGTVVTIKGTGFETCEICSPPIQPTVLFGGVPAASTTLVDSQTITAVTPSNFPSNVAVDVSQWNGSVVSPGAFTFEGEIPQTTFERILLPLLTPPLAGAFGSEFHTEIRVTTKYSGNMTFVHGLTPVCHLSACIPWDANTPIVITQDSPVGPLDMDVEMNGAPGRFLYVRKTEIPTLAMNLRVHDVTRSALNFGTEMPIVREREFVKDRIVLTGVPGDSRFRNTLRVYATEPVTLDVQYGGLQRFAIHLTAGENEFSPAFAQVGNLPESAGTYEVTISALECNVGAPCPGVGEADFWAFISVTNNDTQLISTITPQP